MKRALLFLLICLPVLAFNDDDKVFFEKNQWREIMTAHNTNTILSFYRMLIKNLAEGGFALERETESAFGTLKLVQSHLKVLQKEASGNASIGQRLRELRLNEYVLKAVTEAASRDFSLYSKLRYAGTKICEPVKLKKLSEDFSASGNIGVTRQVESLLTQIAATIEAGGDPNQINVMVGFNFSGGSDSSSSGSGANPYVLPGLPEMDGNSAAQIVIPLVAAKMGASVGGPLAPVAAAAAYIITLAIVSDIFEDRKGARVRKLRDQIDRIANVAKELEEQGVDKILKAQCEASLNHPKVTSILNNLDVRMVELKRAFLEAQKETQTIMDGLRNKFIQEEVDLKELYSVVLEQADNRYELFFKELKDRSKESEIYANQVLSDPLRSLLQAKSERERFAAENKLWEGLLEVDAKYYPNKKFSFQVKAEDDPAMVLAWNGIARAVYKRLKPLHSEKKP